MDARRWWMDIGGVTVWIEVDRDGRPRNVTITRPAVQDTAVPECSYRLDWDRTVMPPPPAPAPAPTAEA
jgi:hypothetical protein